jgi:hypothetical protein
MIMQKKLLICVHIFCELIHEPNLALTHHVE